MPQSRNSQIEGIIDIHCHILPSVDDGAGDMEEALELLRLEYDQGVRGIILTPHYRAEYFETPRSQIRAVFEELQERLQKSGLELSLYLGCEFHRSADMAGLLAREVCYRMAGTRYVLLEFSYRDTMDIIRRGVAEVLAAGFRPIIAHAERYPALRELRNVRFLADSGAYIQVNAGSLTGKEGWREKQYCGRLFREGLVHFVASDAHDPRRRPPAMDCCAVYLEKKIGIGPARKILAENPGKLLRNEYI